VEVRVLFGASESPANGGVFSWSGRCAVALGTGVRPCLRTWVRTRHWPLTPTGTTRTSSQRLRERLPPSAGGHPPLRHMERRARRRLRRPSSRRRSAGRQRRDRRSSQQMCHAGRCSGPKAELISALAGPGVGASQRGTSGPSARRRRADRGRSRCRSLLLRARESGVRTPGHPIGGTSASLPTPGAPVFEPVRSGGGGATSATSASRSSPGAPTRCLPARRRPPPARGARASDEAPSRRG
jgi:hypothetical protein